MKGLRFQIWRGAAAEAQAERLCFELAFQRPAWVQAVASVRRRRHRFVLIRAESTDGGPWWLSAAEHRRLGLSVLESMPMGAYGGWFGGSALDPLEEAELNSCWLRQAPWTLLRLNSAPARGQALPDPPRWPGLQGWGLRDSQTHVLSLAGDEAEALKRVRPSVRSYLRRLDSLGFEFERGGCGALDEFCAWYQRGSEAWAKAASGLFPDAFFAALAQPGQGEIWRVRHGGTVVGGAFFLLGAREVQYQASGVQKLSGPVSAMDALLWAAARHYRALGYRRLNMGASDGLESVRRFKEKFGAEPQAYRTVTYVLPRWAARMGCWHSGAKD